MASPQRPASCGKKPACKRRPFSFHHPSTHNFHHVFVATQVLGEARPHDDAAALNLLALADIRLGRFPDLTSGATRRVLQACASSMTV